jgi:hypothetical protein
MSTYTYSAQAVLSTDNGGSIIIRTTYNGLTWDYYTYNPGTSVRYMLQGIQIFVSNGQTVYSAGQEIYLNEVQGGGFATKYKYMVDANNTFSVNFTTTDLSGATVRLYYENNTINYVELVVGGASESFTSMFEPPTEYQLTATYDATKDMYVIQASDGTNFHNNLIDSVQLFIPSGSTLKTRIPEDPSNNPPLSAGNLLNLERTQVNGVIGYTIDLFQYKDLNFSLAGQMLHVYVKYEAYNNLSTAVPIAEGGVPVSLVLTGTPALVQEPNDRFPITSATTTPTSLTITWAAPTFYVGNHSGYSLKLTYYNTVLNTIIETVETVAPNVLTKTFNGFFANTTITVFVKPYYDSNGETSYGPKSLGGIYEATTSAISGPVPDAVSISSVTPSDESAVINFTAPNTNGSTIDYYFVTINKTNESAKSTKIVAATTPITLDQLDSDMTYDITVTAITSNGQGVTSTVTTFTTTSKDGDGGGGGGDSVILTFVSSTSTTATLTINSTIAGDWGVTTLDGTQLGQGSIISLNADVTITLTGLTPSTSYTVNGSVTAAGKDGGGKGGGGLSVMITTATTTTFSTQSGGGGGGGGGGGSNPSTGISSTYGAATAIKMTYAPLVSVDLDNNEINLVDARSFGHRVQVGISQASLASFFTWSRAANAKAPTAAVDAAGLVELLDTAIANSFTDLDADANGLSYSSSALDSAADDRLRETGANTANDLVMAYVLYRLYGKSSIPTRDAIFNLEDAHGMLDNATLKTAIKDSFESGAGLTAVSTMFKNLISSDPQRFFDASGKQIAGIFEVKADTNSNGIWNLTVDDIIEIRVRFSFAAAITRRDVADGQLSGAVNTKEVSNTETFAIRLQLKVTA